MSQVTYEIIRKLFEIYPIILQIVLFLVLWNVFFRWEKGIWIVAGILAVMNICMGLWLEKPGVIRYTMSAVIVLGYCFCKYQKHLENAVFILLLFYNFHALSYLIADSIYQCTVESIFRGLDVLSEEYIFRVYLGMAIGMGILLLSYTLVFLIMTGNSNREALLLYGNTDKYGIYQLKDNPELDKFRFEGTESLKRMGITKDNFDAVLPENYKLVYMGELAELQGQTQSETLEAIYTKFNIDHPADYKAHSLSVSDIVVLHEDGENSAHFVDSFGFTELPKFMLTLEGRENEIQTEFAVHIADRYILMHECDGGYDYSILNEQYHLLDGGVYDNPDITIQRAMDMVIADLKEPRFSAVTEQYYRDEYLQGEVYVGSEVEIVDYEELSEKAEEVEQADLEAKQAEFRENNPDVVADFRAKTEELFHSLDGQSAEDIEKTVYAYVQSQIDEYGLDAEIVDVVVEYTGSTREDDLFNMLHEDSIYIAGIQVDINPITEGKTGTLATYLLAVESYLAEKQAMQKASAVGAIPEKTVTLTVAECGEFHSLGEFHENIASVEKAIAVWKSIPPERMNGIPSIGINIHTEGTERYEDVEMNILSGKVIDLDVLDYVPDITDDPKAIEVIAELIDKLPDIEVRGSLEKWQAAILALEIDQFSYDYDTYQYRDTVEDREAQVANITEDIRNGNTGYLNDFLNAVISEGVREGITDIFGQGVELDDSEAVQTARRAKELLDKLAEYKPLAKLEELEEQNYNMIDNVLNNGAEKKEHEQTKGRISIREKLTEKKAVIEQRDKSERTLQEKETEKKSQREM